MTIKDETVEQGTTTVKFQYIYTKRVSLRLSILVFLPMTLELNTATLLTPRLSNIPFGLKLETQRV